MALVKSLLAEVSLMSEQPSAGPVLHEGEKISVTSLTLFYID